MSKTPEQLAEEFFRKNCNSEKWQRYIEETKNPTGLEWDAAKLVEESFLAGYQAATSRWIKVEEALPQIYVTVALLNKSYYLMGFIDESGTWHNGQDDETYKPTHWLPLPPEPTKEDNK